MVVRPVCLIPRATFAIIIDVDEQLDDEGVKVPTELPFVEKRLRTAKVLPSNKGQPWW